MRGCLERFHRLEFNFKDEFPFIASFKNSLIVFMAEEAILEKKSLGLSFSSHEGVFLIDNGLIFCNLYF